MNFVQAGWSLPRNTKDGKDVSSDLTDMHFQILERTGQYLTVVPPKDWSARVTQESEGYKEVTIFDETNRPRLRCVEDEDVDDYSPSPADFIYTHVLQ